MKIKRTGRRRSHAKHQEPPGSTVEELAAQLAPPEERALAEAERAAESAAQHGAGAIVVDTGALKMPTGFAESRRKSRFEINRVVVFVTMLMLLFTAFIAWQISRTPDDRDEPQDVRVIPGEQ